MTKADSSYSVTETLEPRDACPGRIPTVVQRYLAKGVKQSATVDLFCNSYVERVFAADGSLRGSRRFERQDGGSSSRLTSVEFENQNRDWRRAVTFLATDQHVQSVTVSFGAKFHNVTLICNRQAYDGSWRINEPSSGPGDVRQIMTVLQIRTALPAEAPTSLAETQRVWEAALVEAAQASRPGVLAMMHPVRAFAMMAE